MRDQREIHIDDHKLSEFIRSSDTKTQNWGLMQLGSIWATFGAGSVEMTEELVWISCCSKYEPSRSSARSLLNNYATNGTDGAKIMANQMRVARALSRIGQRIVSPDNAVHASVMAISFLLEKKCSREIYDSSLKILGKMLHIEGTPAPVRAAIMQVLSNVLDRGMDISAIRKDIEIIAKDRKNQHKPDAEKLLFKANMRDWNRPEGKVIQFRPPQAPAQSAGNIVPKKVAALRL